MRGYSVVAIAQLGKTFYFGVNSKKTHPAYQRLEHDGTLTSSHHAEFDAMKRVPVRKRRLVKLYVMRFDRAGNPVLARPCEHCQKILQQMGVKAKNIHYTTEEGKWGNESTSTI